MNSVESELREIKDRVAYLLGELDEASSNARARENYRRLLSSAKELHKCADAIQNILMKLQPK